MARLLKLFSFVGVLLLGFSVLTGVGTSVYAAETLEESEVQESFLQPETIYQDSEGNIFTNNEVIVQKGNTDPRFQTRAPSECCANFYRNFVDI